MGAFLSFCGFRSILVIFEALKVFWTFYLEILKIFFYYFGDFRTIFIIINVFKVF